MKHGFWKYFVFFALFCLAGPVAGAQSSFDLVSPDRRIEVRIRTAQGIHYDLIYDGREVLRDSTM